MKLISFLASLFAFVYGVIEANNENVIIEKASLRKSLESMTLEGSVAGGTRLYLKVQGLMELQNYHKVYIGQYECPIIEFYFSEQLIICQTQKPYLNDQNLSKLPIVVLAMERQSTCQSTYCTFSYNKYYTPQIKTIVPQVAYPGSSFMWSGKFGISNLNSDDFEGIFIGPYRCITTTTQSSGQTKDVFCQVPNDVEAGVYEYKIQTIYGQQESAGLIQQNYQYNEDIKIEFLPLITKLSTSYFSYEGQIIHLEVKGVFKKNEITVSVLSKSLNIIQSSKISSDITIIQVEIPKLDVSLLNQPYYIQGSGIHENIFNDIRLTFDTFISKMQNSKYTYKPYGNLELQFDSNEDYVYLKGFFKAPVEGSYKFYTASKGQSRIYLSNVPNSIERKYLQLIAQDSFSERRNYWKYYLEHSNDEINSISKPIELDKDQLYYLEIYALGMSSGYLTVSVEIPNYTDGKNNQQIYSLYSITTSYKPDYEILQILLYNSLSNTPLSGTYSLNFGKCKISQIIPLFTEYDFKSRLSNCYYTTEVTRKKIDAQGSIFEDQNEINFAGFLYEIKFTKPREVQYQNQNPQFQDNQLWGGNLGFHSEIIQMPSDRISGTFTLLVTLTEKDNQGQFIQEEVQMSYNTGQADLANKLKSITKNNVSHNVWTKGIAEEGWKWVIQMRDNSIESIELKESQLSPTFKDSDRNVKVSITQHIQNSENLLFEPIPNSLLYTFSTVPQIQLTSKGLLGNCQSDSTCDVIFSDTKTPTLIAYTRENDQLSITLKSGKDLTDLNKDLLTITFAGGDCTNIQTSSTSSPYTYTCTLKSDNGNLILEAGDQVPKVHYEGIGYSKIDDGVTAETIELKILNIDPVKVSPNGGNVITVTGSGFPKNVESSNNPFKNGEYHFNGQRVAPLSISNTQIVFVSPTINYNYDNTLTITFNGKTTKSNSIEFDDNLKLTITELEFTSIGPTFKGLLTISGTNFGTDKTQLNVQLIGSDRTYDAIVTETTDTELKCYLRGGMPGEYQIFVFREGYGKSSSLNNKFYYETVVTGVFTSSGNQNPAVGSESGGTRIKIIGKNFVPSETMIFIGNQMNQICELDQTRSQDELTDTQLFCITPPKHQSYIEPQPIIVTTRITLESVTKCESTQCTFEYKESLTPHITMKEDNFIRTQSANSQQTVTLSNGSGPFKVLFKGAVNEEVEGQLDGDQLTYTVPEIPQGDYFTYVQSEGGYADQMWITKINLAISQITPSTVVKGGQNIIIKGGGFNKNQIAMIRVMIGSQECQQLQIISSIELKCRTPSSPLGSQQICIEQYDTSSIPYQINKSYYSLKITETGQPKITSHSCPSQYEYDTVICTIQGSYLTGYTVEAYAVYQNQMHKDNKDKFVIDNNNNFIKFGFEKLPIGKYQIQYSIDDKFAFFDQTIQGIDIQNKQYSQLISLAGGAEITFTGKGFDQNIDNTKVSICGLNCEILSANFEELVCISPQLLLNNDLSADSEFIDPSQFDIIADNQSNAMTIIDKKETTFYKSSSSQGCYIKIDFGKYKRFKLHQLNYKPAINLENNLIEAQFQYSIENDKFSTFLEIDSNVHAGWNQYVATNPIDNIQKIKLTGKLSSKCQIAEIELKGWLSSKLEKDGDSNYQCDASISINGYQFSIEIAATYSEGVTPVVQQVYPEFGSPEQNTEITITGTGFNNEVIENNKVLINGVDCNIKSVTVSTIICTTGILDQNQGLSHSFKVLVNGNLALNNAYFTYGYKWSEKMTWGGYFKPSNGDSVIVPKGMILIIDESTPQLVQLLVEGTLIVEDNQDIIIDAQYFIVKGGHLIIGTQDKPHQHKVQIILRGEWKDTQMPEFGNKVLGCYECVLDIHGQTKQFTWTLLSETALAKADYIKVDDCVDWVVGDTIFIQSSQNDFDENEIVTIKSIQDNKIITIDPPLKYNHYSAIEEYDTDMFPIKTEVGLLTRNIVIKSGDLGEEYGVSTLIQGTAERGTKVRISYTEFQYGGQPIYNRYSLHFQYNGGIVDSFLKGNSFHHNYARCIVLSNVQHLRLSKNICYDTYGHAIYLETGLEQDNVFEDNLIAIVRQTKKLVKNELTVAGFYITNPQNIINRNRVAGSDSHGFWFDIKTSEYCSQGLNILEFKENYSHSNKENGLRIASLDPLKAPCSTNRYNPPLSIVSSFKSWKNNKQGIYGENLGNILLDDIMIADSGNAAIYIYTPKLLITLSKLLIVGKSKNGFDLNLYYHSKGIILPSKYGIFVTNIKFNIETTQFWIQSCLGGVYNYFVDSYFENVKLRSKPLENIQWNTYKNGMIWDLDGSLTNLGESVVLIKYQAHIDGITGCTKLWGNSIACKSSQVELRNLTINSPSPYPYYLNIRRLNKDGTKSKNQTQNFDKLRTYYFALGFTYEIDFLYSTNQQVNFDYFYFRTSQYPPQLNQKGMTLRFYYTNYREKFEIYKNNGLIDKTCCTDNQENCNCDVNDCKNGQYYHNLDNKYLDICFNNANNEQFKIQAILCSPENCQNAGKKEIKGTYDWNSSDPWKKGEIPNDNDDAVIGEEYNVTLTYNIKLKSLTILGNLILNCTNLTLEANQIWIVNGNLIAGTPEIPFNGSIKIIIGQNSTEFQESSPTQLNEDLLFGDSNILVTGGLLLYGLKSSDVQTVLTKSANKGEKIIYVASSAAWKVGDTIIIGPSGSDPDQTEENVISGIKNNEITLTQNLKHDHYGAEDITIQKNSMGELDMRTVVGHLSRNIKIVGQTQRQKQNCKLIVTQYDNPESATGVTDRGYAILQGVEFSNCTQENNAWVEFKNLQQKNYKINSAITHCSFHNSTSQLLSITNSENITMQNNIFYNGSQSLVRIETSQYITFKQNLLMYVTKGQYPYAVLGDFSAATQNMIKSVIDISENVGQASQDSGFYFMATACSQADQASFTKNKCSSTVRACYGIESNKEQNCWSFQGLYAYHSYVGIQATFQANEIRASRLILVENYKGLILKPGSNSIDNNVIHLTNSFITALARPTCEFCYSDSLKPFCQNTIGIQLGSVTEKTYTPINGTSSTQFDQIFSVSRLDLRVYIENFEFDQFKLKYEQNPYCKNNAVFRQNVKAYDQIGQHYLTDTQCTNCDQDAKLYKLLDVDQTQVGKLGGCGTFPCTGMINALIEDQDGKFFGQISQAIPNNPYFGPSAPYCQKQEEWNGYFCIGQQVTVLNFMSTAPDYRNRLYSPIKLTDGIFQNTLNSFREWNWSGTIPLNSRESKFIGLVSVNSQIDMKTEGPAPTSSDYWLSKKKLAGSPSDWVIIKLQFTQSLMVQVQATNKIIQSGMTAQGSQYDLSTMTHICGANNYYYETRTIHFVVTGALDCKVSLSLKNTLQVSTRLVITTQEFLRERFIQYAIALLGGDPYNYFILGVKLSNRRLLAEGNVGNEITVDWAYADSAEIGTTEGSESKSKLEAASAKLADFQPTEVGQIVSNTAKITSIEELNEESQQAQKSDNPSTSTEPTTPTVPTTPTNSTTSTGSTNTNSDNSSQNSQSNQSNNSQQNENSAQQQTKIPNTTTQQVEEDPPLIPDDSIPYVPPYYNNSTSEYKQKSSEQFYQDENQNVNNQIRKNEKSENQISKELIIVIIVISCIVVISFIVVGYFWFKRNQRFRIAPSREQFQETPQIQSGFESPQIDSDNLSSIHKSL